MTPAQPSVPTPTGEVPFEYAVLRAVPRVDRGEFVNVGVLLYCQDAALLTVGTHVDEARLLALDPALDVAAVRAVLDGVRRLCDQGPPREMFGWLTAPRSTVVQPGPVHPGVTTDPVVTLRRLMDRLVHLATPNRH